MSFLPSNPLVHEATMQTLRSFLMFVLLCSLTVSCEPPKKEKSGTGEATAKAAQVEEVAPAEEPVVAEEPVLAEEPVPEAEETAVADFSVHEWGLSRYAADQLLVSTSPPKRELPAPLEDKPPRLHLGHGSGLSNGGSFAPVPVGKPLVMILPGEKFDRTTEISVKVELVGGTFREVWPTPQAGAQPEHGSAYTWTGIRAQAEPCGRELAPAVGHEACTSIADKGLCEAAEMGTYLSPVPSCLSVGEVRTPALVYNGSVPGAPAPLVLTEGDEATLENRTAHVFGPVYLHQGAALLRVESLEANGKVDVAMAVPFDGELKAVLKRDLLAKGLTEGEADSFVAAWSPDVLRQPWVWQVFGFYSPEGVEAIAPMRVTPQPKEVVRVMAVTIE
ncbi:MAG: hypothetical protein CO108_07710 [Deltaproteobacteria bacterium CG_4_9_14_3_um_filter_63_12]|nr:MAG: hypothetical protein CO108_07710 [Deltaproteobacteria bacterium CG_4_9_14_3_um_filter_63_12]